MTALASVFDPTPLVANGQRGVASAADTRQNQGAWKYAMEQAQLAEWFKPQPASSSASDRQQPNSTAAGRLWAHSAPARAQASLNDATAERQTKPRPNLQPDPSPSTWTANLLRPPAPRSFAVQSRAAAAAYAADVFQPTPSAASLGVAPLHGTGVGSASPDSAIVERTFGPPPLESNLSPLDEMRIHVELAEEGARVWLGLDAARLADLPGLTRQLEQWLRASGTRLATLVCNGRAVYPLQETDRARPRVINPFGQVWERYQQGENP